MLAVLLVDQLAQTYSAIATHAKTQRMTSATTCFDGPDELVPVPASDVNVLDTVGMRVGMAVGARVGERVGGCVGVRVGSDVGNTVGTDVGTAAGVAVGVGVGGGVAGSTWITPVIPPAQCREHM